MCYHCHAHIYGLLICVFISPYCRLCTESVASFDMKINYDHTQECLKRLLVLYDDQQDVQHQCRSEFESLYLLYNLGKYLQQSFSVIHLLYLIDNKVYFL